MLANRIIPMKNKCYELIPFNDMVKKLKTMLPVLQKIKQNYDKYTLKTLNPWSEQAKINKMTHEIFDENGFVWNISVCLIFEKNTIAINTSDENHINEFIQL